MHQQKLPFGTWRLYQDERKTKHAHTARRGRQVMAWQGRAWPMAVQGGAAAMHLFWLHRKFVLLGVWGVCFLCFDVFHWV